MIRNFCKLCGARLGLNAEFCPNCGCRLEPEAPASGLDGAPSGNTAPDAAPALDTAAQSAQQSYLAFDVRNNENSFDLAHMDPDEIFHSFFGDGFPAPASGTKEGTPASAAAPIPDAQGNAPGKPAAATPDTQGNASGKFTAATPDTQGNAPGKPTAATPDTQGNAPGKPTAATPNTQTDTRATTAKPAPDVQKNAPADITALAPDLLALTVDVMADRPVIEPLPADKIFEPRQTDEARHSAAQTPPAKSTAATGTSAAPRLAAAAVPGTSGTAAISDTANATAPGTAPGPGRPISSGAANAAPVPPASGTAPGPGAPSIPGAASAPAPGRPLSSGAAPAPGAPFIPGTANAAPVPPPPGMSPTPGVPPAPQYPPYMYGQPNAGPAPHYAASAPHMPPPYPYAPGPWGYGAPEQPEFISTGSYLGMFLIGMIPLVGLIYLIIQAAGNQWRPNRRNFARGFLAAQAIVIGSVYVLVILAGIFMGMSGYYYY